MFKGRQINMDIWYAAIVLKHFSNILVRGQVENKMLIYYPFEFFFQIPQQAGSLHAYYGHHLKPPMALV